MSYYVYVIAIYNGMYGKKMVNKLYQGVFLIIMKSWLTLYRQVVNVFGDEYKVSMEENGTYCASGVLLGYSLSGVGILVMEVILVWCIVEVRMGYEYESNYESRCLFSWRYLDSIFTFWISRVFCNGWVMNSSFSWRQQRHFLWLTIGGC